MADYLHDFRLDTAKRRMGFVFIFYLLGAVSVFAQQVVQGNVRDENDVPLPGVTVIVKETNIGVASDFDGNYQIEVPQGYNVLVFSSIGFNSLEEDINGRKTIDVSLEPDISELNEVVVVGYGTQRRSNLTGSVSSIKADKLTVAPISNVTNALGGQLAGLKTKQTSGVPGSDGSILSIRGFGNPLVIVDGVETSLSNIDPSQIESISVLKDGSASIYGARAGNGVVLVTLKRGTKSKLSISLNSSYTLQNSTNMVRSGSSGQRAEWAREAHINAGLPSSLMPWTETQIQKFYDGSDPEYLNTDWISEVIRPWSPQQNHNISINTGTDKFRSYTYFGYNKQETISRHDGGGYERINLRNTVDAEVFDGLTLSSSFDYTNESRDFTAMNLGHSNYYFALYDSDPKYPARLPDPTKLSYGGSSYGNALFVSDRSLAGYNRGVNHGLRLNGALTYEPKAVEGLKLKAFFNFNGSYNMSKMFRKQPDFYTYDEGSDTYGFERKAQDPPLLSQGSGYGKDLTQQYSVTYENTFDGGHRMSALALYEKINYDSSGFSTQRGRFNTSVIDQMFAGDPTTASNNAYASEMSRQSFVGRFNYSYENRYLLEAIFRADASAKFPEDGRWGYFPSISLGWVVSKEEFLASSDWIDNLKLRASYGESGDDSIGNYQYYAGYSYDMSYILGSTVYQGLYATGLANPILSWERLKIYNAGIDYSFFGNKLVGEIDGFYRLRDGIPGYRTESLPSTFGASLPLENLNSIDTRGFEFKMGTRGELAGISYDLSGNIAWSRSKWVDFDEPEFTDPDQKRINGWKGKWTDARFGYVSDGLFTSQEEIDNLDYTYVDMGGNETIRPGDVKLKDVNGDGKLDWRDQVEIGKGTLPNWTFGLNAGFKYKNFDLNMLFQGAFDYTTYIDLDTAPTDLKYENRWTEEENSKHSLVPRPGSKNPANWYYSDYRNHNTSYVRLKSAALGYTLNDKFLKKINLSNFRVYVAGTNLLTFSSLDKYGVDPEAPEGSPAYYYPQQRTVSLGISLNY